MNWFKTTLLLSGLTALFVTAGFMLGGQSGMVIALGLAILMNAYAYWNSDKLVLKMHGAQEVNSHNNTQLVGMVRNLAHRANLPMPKVYVIEQAQANAFATGRNPENAAVAVTTGIMESLTYDELAGVMAHELAHIKNRDTLIMTITATLAGALSMLAQFAQFGMLFGGRDARNNPAGFIGLIGTMLLAPLAAMLVQMAISRTREYAADRLGAEICGQPRYLASALQKIDHQARKIVNEPAERSPGTAHMFIINPLKGNSIDRLFSTHPNTENRIRALLDMEQEGTFRPLPEKRSKRGRSPWNK